LIRVACPIFDVLQHEHYAQRDGDIGRVGARRCFFQLRSEVPAHRLGAVIVGKCRISSRTFRSGCGKRRDQSGRLAIEAAVSGGAAC
jgi:hypothetical protein